MRLSELTTDQATNVLCEVSPYIINIMTDEELMAELQAAVDFGESNTLAEKIAIGAGKIAKIVPILLKKRKSDLFGVLAAINGKSVDEIAKQNIIKTMAQVRDVAKDKELLDFFRSCTVTEENE